ncbi:protein RIC-3 [Syngnathus acus]|uniref:protein RIC-3 n=1 Tax=Syngnathus acus TaxID=161584 RepID=UPI001885B1D7|nr:protein RIC-3 [Syngnathus acus]
MSITTCQKVTLISCSVLCVSLFLPRMLLPRAKKEMEQLQAGPGFHPPGIYQVSNDPEQWGADQVHSMTYIAEVTAKVRSIGQNSKKHNLMAQVIPIYGFGILLYILYIIYKLTYKDKNAKPGHYRTTMSMEKNIGECSTLIISVNINRCNSSDTTTQNTPTRNENRAHSSKISRKTDANAMRMRASYILELFGLQTSLQLGVSVIVILFPYVFLLATDDELQERLLDSERIMARIVSGNTCASGSGRRRRSKSTPTKKEEKLLRQLRQIAQLMQEGRVEAASPEMEAEQVPYSADWEGYPEEIYPEYEGPDYKCELDRLAPDEFVNQPTAEALAERMEQEEEEVVARKLSIVQEEDEEEEEGEDVEEQEEKDEEEEVEEEEEEEEGEEQIAEEEEEEEEEEEAEAEKRLLLVPLASQTATNTQHERLGLQVQNELQRHKGGRKHISFNDSRNVFHYPKEDTYEEEMEKEEEDEDADVDEDDGTEVEEDEEEADEEDPVTEAERLEFSSAGCPNPEEEAEQEEAESLPMIAFAECDSNVHRDIPKEVSGLRMRNRREI